MKIFVVIPLYNEKKHIIPLLKGIRKFNLATVVVNDGSRDSDYKFTIRLGARLLTHKVNLGKGSAMRTGADYSFSQGADAVIFMDSDGQHSAEDLKAFIATLKLGKYDVIFGSRNMNLGAPFIRLVGNKVASFVINLFFGIYVSDPICGYRAITKNAYRKIKWESTGYSVESEILARVAKGHLSYTEIPVETIYFDKDKGVTILDAFEVLGDVIKWRLSR